MSNEETEVVVPTEDNNEEIEIDLEETLEEAEQEDKTDWKAEALKNKAIAQRLAKKLKEGGKTEPKPVITKPKTEDVDLKQTVQELALAEKKRQFGYAHGLSPEETDAVFRISPNPTKETLEDPFVSGGLAKIRAKKAVSENTPSSSYRSGKPLTFKPDATPAERQKAHDEWVKGWTPKR